MSKYAQTSINLRPDQMDYMDEQSINTSELLRKLLDQYLDSDDADSAGLEFRLQELRQRRDRLALEMDQLEEEIELVRERLEQREERQQQVDVSDVELLQQTHERFAAYAPGQLARKNAFRDWALEHDWGVQELKQAYLDYRVNMEAL